MDEAPPRTDGAPPRMAPPLTDVNRDFWTGGARGELLIRRCDGCGLWVHPPAGTCPAGGGAWAPLFRPRRNGPADG